MGELDKDYKKIKDFLGGVIILGGSQLNIQTNSNGSVAALSKNGVLLSVATANEDGLCQLNLDAPMDTPGTLDLVVTSYNHVPYETEINVIAPEGSYMLLHHFVKWIRL